MLPFKTRCPLCTGDLHPNIKVVFLPPNTTSTIQPIDQGIIAAFKTFYLKIFAQIIAAIEKNIDANLGK